MREFATAFVGVGSNLDGPLEQVERAITELADLPQTTLVGVSPWYQSKAVGPGVQDDYINGVAQLHTRLTPLELLDQLQAIEAAHQRVRRIHWGPRTLDLDILLYDGLTLAQERLTLPHPFMMQRNFVLVPMSDLAPDWVLPNGDTVRALCNAISRDGLAPLTTKPVPAFST